MKKVKSYSRFLSLIKNKILLFFLLVGGIFFISCNSSNRNMNLFIDNAFPTFENGTVIIVPGSGCTTCLSVFEKKLDSLVKLDSIRLIFTNIISKKLLYNRINEKGLLGSSKIFIDSNNLYLKCSKELSEFWPYPTFIKIEKGKIEKISK